MVPAPAEMAAGRGQGSVLPPPPGGRCQGAPPLRAGRRPPCPDLRDLPLPTGQAEDRRARLACHSPPAIGYRRLALLLAALGLAAQAPRPFCDFGSAIAAMREAQRLLEAPAPALVPARQAAGEAAAALRRAEARLIACGCPRAAERVAEAAAAAERGGFEASAAGVAAAMEAARLRLRWAEEALTRQGCR
ncbi:MAG: hypothetical protein NZN45_03315 [Rhodovarius sp.]|nr:hypothetical protein [Rhodovarius sp.]